MEQVKGEAVKLPGHILSKAFPPSDPGVRWNDLEGLTRGYAL
jgi:hypothetical protein